MATQRFPVPEINSWTPAIDVRASEGGSLFVLRGQNYDFDAKGPKSGFGSLYLTKESLADDNYPKQSLEVAKRTLIFTATGIWEFRGKTFFCLATLNPEPAINIGKFRWTGAFVGYGSYVCHPHHGLWRIFSDHAERFVPIGVPENPIAIAESNGRLIVVSKYLTSYSNSFNASDFTPALGGAGFQVTRERVPGNAITVTSFQGGFFVWTTGGLMIAEFIGGDTVFRFDRVQTDQLMLNMNSWVTLPTGTHVILTRQGLFENSSTSGMKPLTPIFNEFLRGVIRDAPEYSVRLDYIIETDQLFMQIMDSATVFASTYVLSMSLDKWGQFSQPHRGILRFSDRVGQYGFFDTDGFAHRFTNTPYSEKLDGTLTGLDSFIEIGYVRPISGAPQADIELEIQEVLVSAGATVPADTNRIEEDWNPILGPNYGVGFYRTDVDWAAYSRFSWQNDFNYRGPDRDYNQPLPNVVMVGDSVTVYENQIVTFDLTDYNQAGISPDLDYNIGNSSPDVDWNATPVNGVDTSYYEDWYVGRPDAIPEDWGTYDVFVNKVDYGFFVKSNIDGYESKIKTIPSLAIRKTHSDFWTMLTSGHHHSLVYEANQPWQKFHITHLEITVGYQGQIS